LLSAGSQRQPAPSRKFAWLTRCLAFAVPATASVPSGSMPVTPMVRVVSQRAVLPLIMPYASHGPM
jgi:hypothetical protein